MIDKVHKYAERFADNIKVSDRSRYYQFGDWVIRISDHIAQSSDFTMSILTPTTYSCGMYVLHNKVTNTVGAIEYEDLKSLIKSFRILAGNKLSPAKLRGQSIVESKKVKNLKAQICTLEKKTKNQASIIKALMIKLQKKAK